MERVIDELAKKYKLPKVVIREIVESPFRFTAEIMRKGDFESVHLLYLGKFAVKPGRKRFMQRYHKLREYLTSKEKELNECYKDYISDSRGIHELDIPNRGDKEVIRTET